MPVNRLGIVGLALLGIWILTQALLFLSLPIELLVFGAGDVRRLISVPLALLPSLASAVLGIWLIARHRQLAARWFDDDGDEVHLDGHALLRAGILVIAVSAFVSGVASLASAGTRFLAYAGSDLVGAGDALRSIAPSLVAGVAGIVMAALLVVFSAPLSRRLWAGQPRPPRPSGPELAHCPACGAPYDPADYEQGGQFPPTCDACGEPLDIVGT